MSFTNHVILCLLMLAACSFFILHPAQAFTANSLDIVVEKNGDATATFRFTLDGIIENAIPQSVLEDQLKKGLSTGSAPPDLVSMDRSSAVLVLRKFADTSDVDTGTEYRSETMDFKKAEIALQNSGLNGAVTADFTPDSVTVTFPDSYRQQFSNVDVLPSITHIVIDPSRTPKAAPSPVSGTGGLPQPSVSAAASTGSMNVNSSPEGVRVYLDSGYLGDAPAGFSGITPGVHTVDFRKDDYEPVSKNVTILAGKTTHLTVVLTYSPAGASEDSSTFPWPALLVIVVGLLVIATGGYLWWSEKEKTRGNWPPGAAVPKTPVNAPPLEKKGNSDTASVRNSIVIRDITDSPVTPGTIRPETEIPVSTSASRDTVIRTSQLPGAPGSPVVSGTVPEKRTIRNSSVVKVSLLKEIPEEKEQEDAHEPDE